MFGGPLQKLGAWLRLTRGETGSFRLGLALGLPAWIVLVVLAFLHGPGLAVFSLPWIGVHVRLLLVIPLFFACERFVGPVIAEFARNLRESRLVGESEWPALALIIRRVRRLAGGWAAELLLFLLAFGGPAGRGHRRAADGDGELVTRSWARATPRRPRWAAGI